MTITEGMLDAALGQWFADPEWCQYHPSHIDEAKGRMTLAIEAAIGAMPKVEGSFTVVRTLQGHVHAIYRGDRAILLLAAGAQRNEDNAETVVGLLNIAARMTGDA